MIFSVSLHYTKIILQKTNKDFADFCDMQLGRALSQFFPGLGSPHSDGKAHSSQHKHSSQHEIETQNYDDWSDDSASCSHTGTHLCKELRCEELR